MNTREAADADQEDGLEVAFIRQWAAYLQKPLRLESGITSPDHIELGAVEGRRSLSTLRGHWNPMGP